MPLSAPLTIKKLTTPLSNPPVHFSLSYADPSCPRCPLNTWDAPLFNHPHLRRLFLRGLDLDGFATLPADYFSLPHLESFTLHNCIHSTIAPAANLTRSATALKHIKITASGCSLPFSHLELPQLLEPHSATLKTLSTLSLLYADQQLPEVDSQADTKGLHCLSRFAALRYLRVPLLTLFGTNTPNILSSESESEEYQTSAPTSLLSRARGVLPPNLKVLLPEHLVCTASQPETNGTYSIPLVEERIIHNILTHKSYLTPSLSRIWLLYAPYLVESQALNALACRQGVHMTQLWPSEAEEVPGERWLDGDAERLVFGEGEASRVKERGLVRCGNAGWCMRRSCREKESREGLVGWLCQ